MNTLTPDIAFEHSANAAATAWSHRPAYVTYHVATHVSIPSLKRERDIIRFVQARTSDDVALVHDLPNGRVQLTHAFPILPTFDALAYFTLTGRATWHDQLEAYVHDVTPLQYESDPTPQGEHVDVVISRLRAYRVKYAPDSSDAQNGKTHLLLEPYHFVTEQASKDNFFLKDVFIDNKTDLPTHVSFEGPDGLAFSVDYTTIQGQWVVDRAHYEQTTFAPLRIGRVHAIIDASFDQFEFPSTSPDPQLAQ
ncbi:MAG: hypothetical protein JO060_09590 [Candidatus Eremiobacteraeota bacterium]|nr:hypothetical protein [Candidatus Eremiobacteraeota bacterium]MBV9646057.1 hypothetical protein [Candidatus Eremiobacteraeota bacterium]